MAADRSWTPELLRTTEPGRRSRRTIDSVLLFAASTVIGLSAVIASSAARQDEEVGRALTTVLGWANGFWRAMFVSMLVLALVTVVAVLRGRRWDFVRDLVVALL